MLTRRIFLACASATAALVAFRLPGLDARADALSPEAASGFIDKVGKELVEVVNSSAPDATKRSELGRVIDAAVDIPGVAQFCLGRYWRVSSPDQQREFTELFNKVIIVSIGGHLGDYKGVSFQIGRAVPTEGGIGVRTILNRPGNPPARVEWLVSSASGAPKIVDVLAEGTSLRLTQRADYASFMSSNGGSVPALLEALRKQVAGLT